MKKNSRIISLCVAFAILFLTVALLAGLKSYADKLNTENVIKEFNDHAKLPMGLATSEEDLGDVSEYTYFGGFGCYTLEKEGVSYDISGYPDAIDAYHTTSITVTSSAYAIYGICVGEAYSKDIRSIMRSFDFKEVYPENNDRFVTFENDKLSVHFTIENDIITEIRARLETTNKSKVQF